MRLTRVVMLVLALAFVPETMQAAEPCRTTTTLVLSINVPNGFGCELLGTVDMTMSTGWQHTLGTFRDMCAAEGGYFRTTRDGRYINAYCCQGISERPAGEVVGLAGFSTMPGAANPTPPAPPPTPVTAPVTTPTLPPPPPPPIMHDCESRTRVESKVLT
jgi:hypothetical protein